MLRITRQDEADFAFAQCAAKLFESLAHELVVAQVGARRPRQQLKVRHHRFAEQIAGLDGDIQRRIGNRALRPLHPINDASSVRRRFPCTPDGHTRVVDYGV